MLLTTDILDDLRQRILSEYPLLFLQTYEEQRWEDEVANLALEMEYGLVTWSATGGAQPTVGNSASEDAVTFLSHLAEYPEQHLFLLKDFHIELQQPRVVRKLRDLLPQLTQRRQTLLLIGPDDQIPLELDKDVTVLHLPLPGADELRGQLHELLRSPETGITLQLDPRTEDRIVQAVLGLTVNEARKAMLRALRGRDEFSDEVFVELVAEKRHMVSGSDLLEFFDLDESIDDIGGLEGLKEWVQQRAEGFSPDARERGVSNPKGVLLAGIQGCGKSLSAKAIARTLGFPLVRMDMSNLLESARGSSEQNLRTVLHVVETIAPAVLWLEEIDKAFAGFDDEAGQDATMSRILGRFLTWLQEHTAPVFVVATANNVSNLPPELLRRGRFDDLFFVDLPNFHERKQIFEIHLQRRNWLPERFEIEQLSELTEGYSGAEIEQVVNSAIIESYSQDRVLAQSDLEESIDLTVPLSVTMEDEIFHLREWARTRCRPATPDIRVMQVMEEEERHGEVPELQGPPRDKWIALAESGQMGTALVEYARVRDTVLWHQLMTDFEPFMEVSGEYGLVLRADPKVVIWTRLGRKFCDMLIEFIGGRRVFLHQVAASTYDGQQHPNLPPIEQIPESRVAKPGWCPTSLRQVPPATGSGKFDRVGRIRLTRRAAE
ncbi:MAG: AAA family ATPase [Planctomycetaceae bacterium]|nr:AAA family ATPase [Planctomycetaceae bacterium]